MADKLNIKTSASKVNNDKTKAQSDELAKLKKLKSEAASKAKDEQAKAKKNAEEAAAKLAASKASSKANNEELINLAASAISKASKSKSKKFSFSSLIAGLLIGVVIGFVLATVLGLGNVSNLLSDKINDGKESVDEIIDENFLSYSALDFKNVIVGKAVEHQELIVMEQPLEVETTITKSGLANLEIFSKVKNIKYSGRGVYIVDMSKIDEDHIDVDMDQKLVTIKIPHTILKDVILDVDKIQFDDTEKGFLAFGDLSLTSEQQNEIEVSVKNTMNETLNDPDFFKQADEFATLKTWQIFQPLVSAVSPEFVVEMVFE